MNRWTISSALIAIVAIVALGCSSGVKDPLTASDKEFTNQVAVTQDSNTQLWGYYDVYLDLENGSVDYAENRTVAFNANVETFVGAANLGFDINGTPIGDGYVDVDIDVSITHPFSGLNVYDGYDVLGIFIGDGSGTNDYDGTSFGVEGTDQTLMNADGHTRWFNPTEFTTPGILGYTPGAIATPGYTASATANGYKFFADGLGATDDAFTFVCDASGPGNNVFTAGTTNTRNYLLRFPTPAPNVIYNYAICASWESETTHPANTTEAVVVDAVVTDDLFYENGSSNGGDLILDLSFAGYGQQPSTITVESSVTSSPATFTALSIVTGGAATYSTYHIEIPSDSVTSTGGQDYTVIAEYNGFDYSNDLGVPNSASGPLAVYFYDVLFVSDEAYNLDPICDIQLVSSPTLPFDGFLAKVELDASGSTDPEGENLTYEWDFNDDGTFGDPYDSGTDENPTVCIKDTISQISVRVSDESGGSSECSVDADITTHQSKDIDITNGTTPATDIAMNQTNGNLYVFYGGARAVRTYTASSYYQSFVTTVPFDGVLYANAEWIESTDNGNFIISSWSGTTSMRARMYSPAGSVFNTISHGFGTLAGVCDNIALPVNASTFANGLGAFVNWPIFSTLHYTFGHIRYTPTYSSAIYPSESVNPTLPANPALVKPANIVGMEADKDGTHVWICHTTEGYVTRYTYSNMEYSGSFFGTAGTPGDADNLLNDPRDITNDGDNTYYILDELSSGDFVIKGFTVSGTTTTEISSFGSSADWSFDPIRIDGHYEGLFCVLQNDGTDSYVSVMCGP